MSAVHVVRIVWPANEEYGGFVEINESDFDPEKHVLFEQCAEPEKPKRGRKPKAKVEE